MRDFAPLPAVMVLAMTATVLGGFACGTMKGAGKGSNGGTGAAFTTEGDVAPATPPGNKAKLSFTGTPMTVDVVTSQVGPNYVIKLQAYGEILEQESYEDFPSAFSLRNWAGERYDPAIPLLKFPMRVGDTFQWSGRVFEGDQAEQSENASASIATSQDNLTVSGATVPVVRVDADLKIENGTSKPAERRLSFWFWPKHGLVKRDFGGYSSREPVGG